MKIVIVGCTHAGVAAAVQILTAQPHTDVTIYERENSLSFLSSGIPFWITGEAAANRLFYTNPDQLIQLGAHLKLNHNVTKIDHRTKQLWVVDRQTGEQVVTKYDRLIFATGSWPRVPQVSGLDNPHIYLCKTYLQAQRLTKDLGQLSRVAVIGGNYVGCEIAVALRKAGKQVVLVDHHRHLLSMMVDHQYATMVARLLSYHDIQLFLGNPLQSFTETGPGKIVVKTNKEQATVDAVVICAGVRANSNLLQGQVRCQSDGAIVTNEYLQTSDPAIYAAGDVITSQFNPLQKAYHIPLLTNAMRQGTIVGVNVFGNTMKYMGTQATTGLHLFDENIAATGITFHQARRLKLDVDTVTITDNYRPEFMPSTTPIMMTLVWDKRTKRILGGQMMSRHAIDQSINLLSVCLQNRNTIDFLAFVDMLYQPAFDRPFNYLNLLGQAAMAKAAK
jgi:NADPH-dependent 2,4-dienoyl-CoA reductase/sulfur reductase-like enzyme